MFGPWSGRLQPANHIAVLLATMKTTIDLPDDLLRAAKIRAVESNVTLKDLIAQALRSALAAPNAGELVPVDPVQAWCAGLQASVDGGWVNPAGLVGLPTTDELDALRPGGAAEPVRDPFAEA